MSSRVVTMSQPTGNVSYICSTLALLAPFPLLMGAGPALVMLSPALLSLQCIHCQPVKGNCLISLMYVYVYVYVYISTYVHMLS